MELTPRLEREVPKLGGRCWGGEDDKPFLGLSLPI